MTAEYNQEIEGLRTTKLKRLKALLLCDEFLTSATDEAAYGIGFAFFGRMRDAADAIPPEFEALDNRPTVKGQDTRLQPYLRSQLFIALISETEDFLFSLLRLVILRFPKKIGSKTIQVEKLVELGYEQALKETVDKIINELSYARPAEYRKEMQSILSIDNRILDQLWPTFVEMKARRDAGVHNGWTRNSIYERKVVEAGGCVQSTSFLGISDVYFSHALESARSLIEALSAHCIAKFGGDAGNNTVHGTAPTAGSSDAVIKSAN